MKSGPVQAVFICAQAGLAGTASLSTGLNWLAGPKREPGSLAHFGPKCMKSKKEVSLQ
jgi:hypothetical protein